MQTDDADIRREMIRALLPSLYANGRLQSRRYSYVRFRGDVQYESSVYDRFYESNAGGAVIVRYSANCGKTDDENAADRSRNAIEGLCRCIRKYRNQVLTMQDVTSY